MNIPAASGRGIFVDNLFYISPQAAGNLPVEIKVIIKDEQEKGRQLF